MSESASKYLAAAILIFMFLLAFFSMARDTAIMDEVSHLPAGYSYVTQKDMRINPEHPPLIKDLAGASVWLVSKIFNYQIKFPSDTPAWKAETKNEINSQWTFGFDFMYRQGNDADLMLFVGRLPMLIILLILGLYIFKWTKKLWGRETALLALFLFSFSPTFIAHGRFVTTDVAAAAGFFIATYYFFKWLQDPKLWNLISASIFFGLAQLAKFSLFLLVPFFGFLSIVWVIIKIINQRQVADVSQREPILKIFLRYLSGLALIFLFGYAFLVTPLYYFHIKNYPPQKQQQNMRCILASYSGGPLEVKQLEAKSPNWCMEPPTEKPLAACQTLARIGRCPADIAIWTADKSKPVRAFGQYLLGLVMVVQRASGGNTTYFLGEISASGSRLYFLIVYLLKEPLALHVLTLMAVIIFAYYAFIKKERPGATSQPQKTLDKKTKIFLWLNQNFESFAMLFFIAFYLFTSMRSPLNIGVRHILPIFPFIYMLVSSQIIAWVKTKKGEQKMSATLKRAALIGLIAWQAFSVVSAYPSFLPYFNEIIGGSKNGYKYVTDSNVDWGQDLFRLKEWLDKNNINKIYAHYFGGSTCEYYLGDKFLPWWGDRNPADLKSGDWLAVSATLLQGGRGKPAPGFNDPTGYYNWLNEYEPKTVIGHSIFVYQMP
jgi:hypothetical protein